MDAYHGSWQINHAKTINMPAFLQVAGFPEDMVKEFCERDWHVQYGKAPSGKLSTKVKVVNRPNLPEKLYEITLDEEQELEGVDGDKTISKVSWDGSKFIESHRSVPGAPMAFDFNISREVKGNEMIFTSTMKGVTLTEVYTKC